MAFFGVVENSLEKQLYSSFLKTHIQPATFASETTPSTHSLPVLMLLGVSFCFFVESSFVKKTFQPSIDGILGLFFVESSFV